MLTRDRQMIFHMTHPLFSPEVGILIRSMTETRLIFPYTYDSNCSISFNALNIETLEEYTKSSRQHSPRHRLKNSLLLLNSLSKQLFFLREAGWAAYGFSPSDILVVDNCVCVLNNPSVIVRVNNQQHITFLSPFTVPVFADPVLKDVTELPHHVHANVEYYSVAMFFLYCAYGHVPASMTDILTQMEGTDAYYFVCRCIDGKMYDRVLKYN